MAKSTELMQNISELIYEVRGQKVMLDSDLGRLYGVETKVLNQQVNRNIERFPEDFMFQITLEERGFLRSQFVTSNEGRGGRRFRPYVFTENGVAMLSSVLRSKKAIKVNIEIMRFFTQMRHILFAAKSLEEKLKELEREFRKKSIDDEKQFKHIFQAINSLIDGERKDMVDDEGREIGFRTDET